MRKHVSLEACPTRLVNIMTGSRPPDIEIASLGQGLLWSRPPVMRPVTHVQISCSRSHRRKHDSMEAGPTRLVNITTGSRPPDVADGNTPSLLPKPSLTFLIHPPTTLGLRALIASPAILLGLIFKEPFLCFNIPVPVSVGIRTNKLGGKFCCDGGVRMSNISTDLSAVSIGGTLQSVGCVRTITPSNSVST